MFKIKSAMLAMALLVFSFVNAQTLRYCGTHFPDEQELQNNPQLKQRIDQLETFTQDYTANYSTNKLSATATYVIPIVIHIIHSYGSDNISRAQVMDAMRMINEDFQKLNADTTNVVNDFKSIIGDGQIEFRLAQLDPNGNCTDGITRTYSLFTQSAGENVKTLVMWDHTKYLNIWVVNNIASGAGGYAYLPTNAGPTNDGIVIRNQQFGAIGTASATRSITHEIGHYLNLKHTWGGTNNPGLTANCNDDDLVTDTPNTIGNTSCNVNAVSCGSLDNVQNFMEYSFCDRMFTQGQVVRMHACLNSSQASRNNLWSSANLIATGTNDGYNAAPCLPKADFKSSVSSICEGTTINYTDFSWKAIPATYSWSFPGGTPSSSSVANPSIQYNTAGTYDVSLTVSNASGSDTKTVTNAVQVLSAAATNNVPFSEGFESGSLPYNSWVVENGGGNAWQKSNVAAYSGSSSYRLYNFTGNASGTIDAFVTQSYDLSNVSAASMTFKMAFAVRSTSSTDQLRLLVSSTCGQFWTQRMSKVGTSLSTAGLYSTDFVPNGPQQWREEYVNLASTSFSGKPNLSFKFEYTHDSGNNIYIDDINIDGLVGISETAAAQAGLTLYPNPATETTRVAFTLQSTQHVTVHLIDMLGRDLGIISEGTLPAGEHYAELNNLPAAGVYMIRLQLGTESVTQKLIVN